MPMQLHSFRFPQYANIIALVRQDWTVQFLLFVLLFDCVVIAAHLAFGQWSTFFHLDHEHNIPTIFQSVKLLTAGYITLFSLLQSWQLMTPYKRWLLTPLASLFIYLGLDELGQIHENVERFVREVNPHFADGLLEYAENLGYVSSTWILYYIPFFIIVGIYGVFLLQHILRKHLHLMPSLLFFGFTLFLVVLFEIVSNQGQVASSVYDSYILLEEAAEMTGITIGVFFAIQLQREILRIED